MRDDAFEIRVRDHFIKVDQPHDDGTDDLGPTPTELFAAAMAACAGYYARRFLARHGLDDHVIVSADWGSGTAPARITDITMQIVVPELPADLYERCLASVRRCTLKNTLEDPPDLRIELQATSGSAAVTRRAS
jgi:uncharacterized OsmC-like protein